MYTDYLVRFLKLNDILTFVGYLMPKLFLLKRIAVILFDP